MEFLIIKVDIFYIETFMNFRGIITNIGKHARTEEFTEKMEYSIEYTTTQEKDEKVSQLFVRYFQGNLVYFGKRGWGRVGGFRGGGENRGASRVGGKEISICMCKLK